MFFDTPSPFVLAYVRRGGTEWFLAVDANGTRTVWEGSPVNDMAPRAVADEHRDREAFPTILAIFG